MYATRLSLFKMVGASAVQRASADEHADPGQTVVEGTRGTIRHFGSVRAAMKGRSVCARVPS